MAPVSFDTFVLAARSGSVISFPTDTVPALAVRPDQAERIFALKQRSQDKPLILMGASSADLWPFVKGNSQELEIWQQVAQRYWPGALTLVLPASESVPMVVHPADPTTIGLRVPNHDLALRILSQTGPLATTSVNRSGDPPLQTMAEIETQFPDVLTLLSQDSESAASAMGTPSTVAKWANNRWEILRQGGVKLEVS